MEERPLNRPVLSLGLLLGQGQVGDSAWLGPCLASVMGVEDGEVAGVTPGSPVIAK